MTDTLAFPDAVGYGSTTQGGRGGAVVIVTNLNDDGPGSLRWALEDVKGPRTVVFEVSGAIALKSQILIQDPFVTIAGQSAPGDGITIEGARIRVKADEVIVRGLHFRPGDGDGGQDAGDRDGLFIGTTDFEINNVVVDHNTFTWAIDENLTVNGHVRDISISNNIIAQGLSNSIHPKGEHSKGLLISNWEGAADWASNISIVGNLFAGNQQRNPEVRAGQNVEIVNNFIYDYGLGRAAIAVGGGSGGTLATSVYIIGNVMMAGPDTSNAVAPIAVSAMGAGSSIYIADNLWQSRGQSGLVDQSGTAFAWDAGGLRYVTTQAGGSGLNVLNATDVVAAVLANAGASPTDRDAIDSAIIELVRGGGALIVDSVAEAGGYLPSGSTTAAADFDRDGMPDWFESLYGFDSRTFNANGDNDRDGYTNIEEYLNGLISGFDLPLTASLLEKSATAGVADVLALTPQSAGAPVHMAGMNAAEGDRIDISALLAAIPASARSASDYIDIKIINGKTVVFFDSDGAGTAQQAHVVAVVDGVFLPSVPGSAAQAATPVTAPATAPVTPAAPPLVQQQTGGDGVDRLHGSAGVDYLFGGAGNDLLDGGAGADRLVGGLGDDNYVVDNVGDVVVEAANEGNDTVSASVSFSLGENIENLTLTSSASINGTGNALNNRIAGNAGANVLMGLDGDDSLSGGAGDDRLDGGAGKDRLDGGLGDDVMAGGLGDDTYVVDSTRDVVIELLDSGVDSVSASVSYGLTDNLENLTLTGTSALDGTGNDLANKLTGNAGANVLLGLGGDDTLSGGAGDDQLIGGDGKDKLDGGSGGDRMEGGAGDDTYVVDDIRDVIFEQAGNGIDSVTSAITFQLDAQLENLTLSGALAINGSGNASANKLIGNDADNRLSGFGGADDLRGGGGRDILDGGDGNDKLDGGLGEDTLLGGAGDDSYTIDNIGDTAVEASNQGIDTIVATVSWSLGSNFEHLTLGGSENLSGTGNELANRVTGNSGANALEGLAGNDTLQGLGGNDTLSGGAGDDTLIGGTGFDTLTGGAGADLFVFATGDSAFSSLQQDQIIDFTLEQDQIQIRLLNGTTITTFANASISGNSIKTALSAAEQVLSGSERAVIVSGASDAWLFWDDPATTASIDGVIQLTNGSCLPWTQPLASAALAPPNAPDEGSSPLSAGLPDSIEFAFHDSVTHDAVNLFRVAVPDIAFDLHL